MNLLNNSYWKYKNIFQVNKVVLSFIEWSHKIYIFYRYKRMGIIGAIMIVKSIAYNRYCLLSI